MSMTGIMVMLILGGSVAGIMPVVILALVVPGPMRGETLLAMEGVKNQTEGIQTADEQHQIGETGARRMRQMHRFQDRVLGEKPGERRQPRIGERADEHGEVGD